MNDCFFLVSGFRHCRDFLFYVDPFGNSLILEVIFALTESVLGSEVSLFFVFLSFSNLWFWSWCFESGRLRKSGVFDFVVCVLHSVWALGKCRESKGVIPWGLRKVRKILSNQFGRVSFFVKIGYHICLHFFIFAFFFLGHPNG